MVDVQPVIVIGAGAAGLMAAGAAADAGAAVILLERMRQTGRKVRITGRGRCNLTNTTDLNDFLAHFDKGGRFLRQAVTRFDNQALISHIEGLGVSTEVQRGGRVFPRSGSAVEVAEALDAWVRGLGVVVETGVRVRGVALSDGRAVGVHFDRFSEDGMKGSGGARGRHDLPGAAVILATGGLSYPSTGTTGDGYTMAKALGHGIVPTWPTLVPLLLDDTRPPVTATSRLRNVAATLWLDGRKAREKFGELDLTPAGVGGPIIRSLSRIAVPAFAAGRRVELTIDLKPALTPAQLDARLIRNLEDRRYPAVGDLLADLLPAVLIPAAVVAWDLPPDKPCHQITGPERKRLGRWLKEQRYKVLGDAGFKEAIVTAGGVARQEVDPLTFESRLVPGLYICGEVLDVDGDTGGYNLQAAFAMGRAAGLAAAGAVAGPV